MNWARLTAATLLAMSLGLGATYAAFSAAAGYGLWLFVIAPLSMGLVAGFTAGSRTGAITALHLAFVLTGIALLALAWEGMVCIVLAAFPALAMGWFGVAVALALRRPVQTPRQAALLLCASLALTPLSAATETILAPEPPVFPVVTSVEIAAPPERVWQYVVSFAELPPPTEWLFRAGIAYPVRAEIDGRGPGAIRRCVFSTGPFIEPVTAWDEPRLLAFDVVSTPAPMQEWTPYREIHPPHLDGYFISKKGQFRLVPLAGGRATRLEGTTWYRHGLWPAFYWKWWSDAIIHRIHLRVLNHIKARAEA